MRLAVSSISSRSASDLAPTGGRLLGWLEDLHDCCHLWIGKVKDTVRPWTIEQYENLKKFRTLSVLNPCPKQAWLDVSSVSVCWECPPILIEKHRWKWYILKLKKLVHKAFESSRLNLSSGSWLCEVFLCFSHVSVAFLYRLSMMWIIVWIYEGCSVLLWHPDPDQDEAATAYH